MWVIPEGNIPAYSTSDDRRFISHETACILNTGEVDAHVEIFIYYSDRDPAGPYLITIPGKRTLHLRFNDLKDPEPIPRDTDYSSVISSDQPVIVQHTRLDSRRSENSLITTIAYPVS